MALKQAANEKEANSRPNQLGRSAYRQVSRDAQRCLSVEELCLFCLLLCHLLTHMNFMLVVRTIVYLSSLVLRRCRFWRSRPWRLWREGRRWWQVRHNVTSINADSLRTRAACAAHCRTAAHDTVSRQLHGV